MSRCVPGISEFSRKLLRAGNLKLAELFGQLQIVPLFSNIKWNFTKFVINKEGKPVARFGPTDDPIPAVENKVKELMAEP